MKKKELNKLLAGVSIAGLIGAGGAALPGAHAAGSGWGAKPGAGSVEKVKKPASGSGWAGNTKGAVSAHEEKADDAAEKGKEAGEDAAEKAEKLKKPKAKSGWSG